MAEKQHATLAVTDSHFLMGRGDLLLPRQVYNSSVDLRSFEP